MGELSERQQEILKFIRRYMAEKRYAPSMREIGDGVGITTTSLVSHHLKALVEAGYIGRDYAVPRGIWLTEQARSVGC